MGIDEVREADINRLNIKYQSDGIKNPQTMSLHSLGILLTGFILLGIWVSLSKN